MEKKRFSGKRGLKRHKILEQKFQAKRIRPAAEDVEEEAKAIDGNLSATSSGMSDEETGDESPTIPPLRRTVRGGNEENESDDDGKASNSAEESNLENESEDDGDASDSDEDRNSVPNDQSHASTSSFILHMGYKLPEGDVENLSKKKWKYKWEVPAFNKSNCKWVGTGECFLKDVGSSTGYGLKKKLYSHWLDVYDKSGGNDFHSSRQRHFFSLCNSYKDILHSNKKPFHAKGKQEDSSIMDAYIMHSLNHIFRTTDLVKKNDKMVAKYQESENDDILYSESFRDHGFTRPKVLILLPFRSIAFRVVKRLIQLTPQVYKIKVEHFDRFSDEFQVSDEDSFENDDRIIENVENAKSKKPSKPDDHRALFSGNVDDNFMIGIKFKRGIINLYSDFYSSDMIVASPLCLNGKLCDAKLSKDKDVDYLSSIEVLVIDHADVIAMQNWQFLVSVLDELNRLPTRQHGTDIMRIRKWHLDGHARFYRQSIILGFYANPDINASFNHQCLNYEGKVKLVCEYKGVLTKISPQVRQIYERFDAKSVADADEARFHYFTNKVFPKIRDSAEGGILLFMDSYFEFVRLRNFLKSQDASFCLLGDYTTQSDISRARTWFFQGQRKIMLYTGRAHFYHRYKIRGLRSLIMYSLPERKEFYPEFLNMLEDNMMCSVLFSQFDLLRLERIVGNTAARRMITSEKRVFAFC